MDRGTVLFSSYFQREIEREREREREREKLVMRPKSVGAYIPP